MNSQPMLEAIGLIDDTLVLEALDVKKQAKKSPIHLGVIASFAAAVMVTIGTVSFAYYTPTSLVTLDVNPSIQFSLNTFDRVLTVTGINEDGEEIVDEILLSELKSQKIETAIERTIESIAQKGYLSDDEQGGIIIAVSDEKEEKAQELSEELRTSVKKVAEEKLLQVEVESIAVGAERVEEARRLGVTPGKLNLVEKLRDSAPEGDDVDIEEWLKKPVKDIMKETKENKMKQKEKTGLDKSEEVDIVAIDPVDDDNETADEKILPNKENQKDKERDKKNEAKMKPKSGREKQNDKSDDINSAGNQENIAKDPMDKKNNKPEHSNKGNGFGKQ